MSDESLIVRGNEWAGEIPEMFGSPLALRWYGSPPRLQQLLTGTRGTARWQDVPHVTEDEEPRSEPV